MAAIIYSKVLCPYCEMAKKLLDEKNVPYEELIIGVDISKDKTRDISPNGETRSIVIKGDPEATFTLTATTNIAPDI